MGETTLSTETDLQKETSLSPAELRNRRKVVIITTIGLVVFIAVLVVFLVYLANPATPTQKIRDIFIIFMGLETLILGLALVVLIIQLARLINLLQNEIKPILNSTNETVNTLRGTTAFLSDNIVEPVIKLNEYFAAFKEMFKLVRFTGKR